MLIAVSRLHLHIKCCTNAYENLLISSGSTILSYPSMSLMFAYIMKPKMFNLTDNVSQRHCLTANVIFVAIVHNVVEPTIEFNYKHDILHKGSTYCTDNVLDCAV